ncbi:hypothetical protein K6119_12460 [Paracrocinitomix mangrovi]|uniref:hypothetical protein n=1 Tax=Paracrocinitomix mangrovi TaxID=2862509 RepID=UPI001C8CF990|nr:hypothetical protein [Paracrocinitomix mangrovi]UKN00545.1 hypothetical protein K6119_12460 [Paracrocinitomix mangrovi]
MKSLKPYIIALGLFLILNHTYSQENHKIDSTSLKKITFFPKEYGDKKWKILLGLDARRSFFHGHKIKLAGLKIGAEYKGVHRFGLGFYWINKPLIIDDFPVTKLDAADSTHVRFKLGYSSFYYERVFIKTRYWEVSFPVHLGGGRIEATYLDSIGAYPLLYERPFSCLTLATQTKFYPIKWFYLKISGGYRQTFNTEVEVKKAFNRPFYSFGCGISISELYRAIFPKKEKATKTENPEMEIR